MLCRFRKNVEDTNTMRIPLGSMNSPDLSHTLAKSTTKQGRFLKMVGTNQNAAGAIWGGRTSVRY
jgi:hypothetical protein